MGLLPALEGGHLGLEGRVPGCDSFCIDGVDRRPVLVAEGTHLEIGRHHAGNRLHADILSIDSPRWNIVGSLHSIDVHR